MGGRSSRVRRALRSGPPGSGTPTVACHPQRSKRRRKRLLRPLSTTGWRLSDVCGGGVSIGPVDTNVLLRHILGDHPGHSPRAKAFVTRLERGELVATLADTVVFKTVFVLES